MLFVDISVSPEALEKCSIYLMLKQMVHAVTGIVVCSKTEQNLQLRMSVFLVAGKYVVAFKQAL